MDDAPCRQFSVHFDKRSHNRILREAALDRQPTPIPGLKDLPVAFSFPRRPPKKN